MLIFLYPKIKAKAKVSLRERDLNYPLRAAL